MKFTATLQKESQRRLDVGTMKQQVNHVIKRMLDGKRGEVWSCRPRFSEPQTEQDRQVYSCKLIFDRIGRKVSDEVQERQYNHMLSVGQAAGNASSWSILELASKSEAETGAPVVETDGEAVEPKSTPTAKTYADALNLNRADHFDGIYDREPQIETLHSALRAFVASDYNDRFHAVMYGEPGSGKTSIAKAFAKMLGKDAVLELDATSTTKAGAERILLDGAFLPPVLVIEEIEKTAEASLRWLLSALDQRAEVRKVTHGGGLRQKDVKMFCIATVNDMELFRKVMSGALASRFTWQLKCPRPSREVLQKILEREVDKTKGGNREWIKPTLDFCVDQMGVTDPRRCIAACLCGREKLLTGEYQKTLAAAVGHE